jgi:hypothetical protein
MISTMISKRLQPLPFRLVVSRKLEAHVALKNVSGDVFVFSPPLACSISEKQEVEIMPITT